MVKHCENVDEVPVIEDLWSLKIKTLRGSDSVINVNPSTKVGDVKEKLCPMKSITIEQQRLIYRGRVLKDSQTVSECHIKDGDTIHLVIRQSPPADVNPNPDEQTEQNSPQPNANENDEVMIDIESEISQESMSNLLNQLFDDITQQTGVNAPRQFLIDQLRRSLNVWNREVQQANVVHNSDNLNVTNNQNDPVPYPEAWSMNISNMRRALEACQSEVATHLPSLFDRANALVQTDQTQDAAAFGHDMRNVAINFRRLGKVFSILGRLCNEVRTDANGRVELERRSRRQYPVRGVVVTQTQLLPNSRSGRGRGRIDLTRGRGSPRGRGRGRGRTGTATVTTTTRSNRTRTVRGRGRTRGMVRVISQQTSRPQSSQSNTTSMPQSENIFAQPENLIANFLQRAQQQARMQQERMQQNQSQGGQAPAQQNQNAQQMPFNPFSMYLATTRRMAPPAPGNPNSQNPNPNSS